MAQPVKWPLTVYGFPYESNCVYIQDANGVGVSEKILPPSSHFDSELVVGWPTWPAIVPLALRVSERGQVMVAAEENNSIICLYRYGLHRKQLFGSTPLLGDHDEQGMSDMGGTRLPMLQLGGFTFIANREFLLKIKENLETEIIPVGEGGILKMLAMQGPNSLRLVLVTEAGCVMLDPFQEKTELREVDFFAGDDDYEDAQLIGENHVVIARQNAAEVYELNRMSCSGRIVFRVSFPNDELVAVLPTADRNRFAVLTQRGELHQCGLSGE